MFKWDFLDLTRPDTLYIVIVLISFPPQGVITDDVVGRPTELRFFYKEQESDNYVVYFPNFNLTARDPGRLVSNFYQNLKNIMNFFSKIGAIWNNWNDTQVFIKIKNTLRDILKH